MIGIFAIYLNQNPDYIFINCDNCSFTGHSWKRMNSIGDLKRRIVVRQLAFHDTIFGQKYCWINHHRSDVLRLVILMNYGGIFLDNDCFLVKSLDRFRKFDIAVSWDDRNIEVQVMIAHRNARLLKAHFDMYRYMR